MTDFALRNEADRSRLLGYISGLDLSKPRKVVVKDMDRSASQNRALHAALSDIAAQVEHGGKKWDVTIWKRLCTAAWLREEGEQALLIPAIDGHGFDLVFARTSKLTVKQCASLLEWIYAYGAENSVKWSTADHYNGRY